MSMVLAMAGLFGVLSHVVMRRMREMGIRIALGADRGRIFRLILFDGMQPVAKGIVLGLVIGVGARLAVRAWVVTDISAFEPLVLAMVPIPFVVAALVACYVPGRARVARRSQRRAARSVTEPRTRNRLRELRTATNAPNCAPTATSAQRQTANVPVVPSLL